MPQAHAPPASNPRPMHPQALVIPCFLLQPLTSLSAGPMLPFVPLPLCGYPQALVVPCFLLQPLTSPSAGPMFPFVPFAALRLPPGPGTVSGVSRVPPGPGMHHPMSPKAPGPSRQAPMFPRALHRRYPGLHPHGNTWPLGSVAWPLPQARIPQPPALIPNPPFHMPPVAVFCGSVAVFRVPWQCSASSPTPSPEELAAAGDVPCWLPYIAASHGLRRTSGAPGPVHVMLRYCGCGVAGAAAPPLAPRPCMTMLHRVGAPVGGAARACRTLLVEAAYNNERAVLCSLVWGRLFGEIVGNGAPASAGKAQGTRCSASARAYRQARRTPLRLPEMKRLLKAVLLWWAASLQGVRVWASLVRKARCGAAPS